jgi:predicted HTH domain antitoxin
MVFAFRPESRSPSTGFRKASELAEISRFAFAELAEQRNIPRHYTENELTQDIGYARRQSK